MIKISQLEMENVKRIKVCSISFTASGLTIIGGDNNQGKTSVLDAIAWALGGNKFKPTQPHRDGSVIPPSIRVTLSNGLIVERRGVNSDLKVIDPEGQKGGQQLLNEFVEELAINLPKFMESSAKEKAQTLLRIIGVGEQLLTLERSEAETFANRLAIGQIADQKAKYVAETTLYENVPADIVSASALIMQQQSILAKNGENQRKRERRGFYQQTVLSLREQMDILQGKLDEASQNLAIANTDALDLLDEGTEELERNIADVDAINAKVRANLDREKVAEEQRICQGKYEGYTAELTAIRQSKIDLLKDAKLPLDGLSVDEGELTYQGKRWDNMSGSDQLKVSAAIVRAINPKCGFVLMDKLEQMDAKTLTEFGAWLEQEGLQAIATRVSTGGECSIIIEDGYVKDESIAPPQANWKAGEF